MLFLKLRLHGVDFLLLLLLPLIPLGAIRDAVCAREMDGVAKTPDVLLQRGDGVLFNQQIARSRNHHRIDDQIFQPILTKFIGYNVNDRRVGEHAGLERVCADVTDYRIDLRRDELRIEGENLSHSNRVLRRDGGDRRCSVNAQRREGFEIGLNPCAGAGGGTGDGERFANSPRLSSHWR